MAKTWDDFIPLLQPHLPGCQAATMKTYLASTAADFFARSYLWRDSIDAIYLAPNQIEYDLDADAEVEDVISVVYKGQPLTRTDIRLIPHERMGETGDPRSYWVQADKTIRVFPAPDDRGTLSVVAVLKPPRTGPGVENWIFEVFAEAIVSGTIAQLAAIPNKDWTDVALAGAHLQRFSAAITQARVRDFRGVRLSVKQRPAA